MKISQKHMLAAALSLTMFAQSSFAQTVKFVTIDSASASFQNPDAIEARKAKALDGLQDLSLATPEFMNALNEAAKDKDFKLSEMQYYTAEYIKVPFEQYRSLIFDPSGVWSDNTYGDIGYNKKAIVLRRATPAEQEKNIQKIKSIYADKRGTPIATNNVELSKLVGKPAPNFTVTTMDGKKISLKNLKGKVVLLNFWFTQCRPCVEEIPTLNKFVEKYKGNKNVVFLAPEVRAEATVEDLQKFQKRVPFAYQTVLGGKDAATLYQAKVFPANFVIDKKGIVRMGYAGYNPFALEELGNMIPKLLDEKSGSTVSNTVSKK